MRLQLISCGCANHFTTAISLCRYTSTHTRNSQTIFVHHAATPLDHLVRTPVDRKYQGLGHHWEPRLGIDACLSYGSVSWCLCLLRRPVVVGHLRASHHLYPLCILESRMYFTWMKDCDNWMSSTHAASRSRAHSARSSSQDAVDDCDSIGVVMSRGHTQRSDTHGSRKSSLARAT